jgi:hypothetical protein
LELIKDLLASDSLVYIKKILDFVIEKGEQSLVKVFQELRENNYNQKDFYKDLFAFLHQDLLINLGVMAGEPSYSVKINQFFLKEILSTDLNQETPIPFLVLELKFLEIIERSKKNPPNKSTKTESKAEVQVATKPKAKEDVADLSKKKINKSDLKLKDFWQNLIKNFTGENFSLVTLLKSCKLESLSEGIARVFVYYSFHKEQLEQNKNKELLIEATKKLFDLDLQFDFVLQDEVKLAEVAEASDLQAESELLLAAKDSLL